jgi:hypothetical protein
MELLTWLEQIFGQKIIHPVEARLWNGKKLILTIGTNAIALSSIIAVNADGCYQKSDADVALAIEELINGKKDFIFFTKMCQAITLSIK